jgi:hypothetical protein
MPGVMRLLSYPLGHCSAVKPGCAHSRLTTVCIDKLISRAYVKFNIPDVVSSRFWVFTYLLTTGSRCSPHHNHNNTTMGPELPGLVRSLPPLLLSQPAHVSRLASVLTQLVHYQQQAGVNGLHHQPHGPAAPPPQAATAQVNLSGRPAVLSSTAGSQWTGGGCSSNACTPSQHPAPGAAAAPPTYSRLLWLCASLGRQPSHWQPAGSALGPVALRAFSSVSLCSCWGAGRKNIPASTQLNSQPRMLMQLVANGAWLELCRQTGAPPWLSQQQLARFPSAA